MFKLIDKKIIAILRSQILLNWPMIYVQTKPDRLFYLEESDKRLINCFLSTAQRLLTSPDLINWKIPF